MAVPASLAPAASSLLKIVAAEAEAAERRGPAVEAAPAFRMLAPAAGAVVAAEFQPYVHSLHHAALKFKAKNNSSRIFFTSQFLA